VAMTADGRSLYVTNYLSNTVAQFDVDGSGTLNPKSAPTLPTGSHPFGLVVTPDQAPVAALAVTAGAAGSETMLDASGSSDADGSVAQYRWEFGDGAASTTSEPVVKHVYAAGSYVAKVTVADNRGCSTQLVYTGQIASCAGGAGAATSQPLTVLAGSAGGGGAGGDTTPPAAPAFTGSTPVSRTDNNNPRIRGIAEAGSTVKLFTTADCTGRPLATGSAEVFANPGIQLHVRDDSRTTLRATATDAAGNVSGCSGAPFTYVERTHVAIPIRGRVGEVPGVSRRIACKAFVTAKLYIGKRRVALVDVRLDRRCRWKAAPKVKVALLRGVRRLRLVWRYNGNNYTSPRVYRKIIKAPAVGSSSGARSRS
jgi:PKD domain-containing protein